MEKPNPLLEAILKFIAEVQSIEPDTEEEFEFLGRRLMEEFIEKAFPEDVTHFLVGVVKAIKFNEHSNDLVFSMFNV